MSNQKPSKHKGVENKDLARAMHALRSSGAAGFHRDSRLGRQRTRSASKRAAITSGW